MQKLSMVHGRLPGSSWLGWPSGKEKRREEFQTISDQLQRSFYGNCHFPWAVNDSVHVTMCILCRWISAAGALVWTGSGGWEGRRNGQDSKHSALPTGKHQSLIHRLAWYCHAQAEQPAQISWQSQRKDASAPFLTPTVCLKGTFLPT